jgi:mono/diheme cytochrome c family protein
MNDQQISNIIEYLKSIQVPMEGCGEDQIICADGHLPAGDPNAETPTPWTQDEIQRAAEAAVASGQYDSVGEALFNLSLASGAYSCARCHTAGWSYGDPRQSGGGAFGPNLSNGSTVRQFPNAADHVLFVDQGSVQGKRYGQQGQGTGRMPGFGQMLSDDQIKAIVDYERGL